jgi:hypothetical protein
MYIDNYVCQECKQLVKLHKVSERAERAALFAGYDMINIFLWSRLQRSTSSPSGLGPVVLCSDSFVPP